MLNHTSFCSRPRAAHGNSVRLCRTFSVAVSAAVVGACTITPAAKAIADSGSEHSVSISQQSLPILPVAEQSEPLDLYAALFKGRQCSKTARHAQQTRTQERANVAGTCLSPRHQQARSWQKAREHQTGCAADGISALPPAYQQQQQQQAATQQQRRQRHGQIGKQQQQRQQRQAKQRKPWTSYHACMLRLLRQRPDLLPAGSSVLVAVSGGQDSMALLQLLSDLAAGKHWPLQLTVAHCDHRMRPDSAANAAFVQQTAEQLGLECCVRTAEQELRGEDTARKWRLGELQDIAQQRGCSCYVLGHTATDRAETLLFNLVRGAGAAGLSSMGWEREVLPGLHQVRPLLWMDRSDSAAFCTATGMQLWEDSTNYDTTFAARNMLRLSVFPQLIGINAKAVQHIAAASELLAAEDDLLRRLAKQQLVWAEVKYVLQPGPQQQKEAGAAVTKEQACIAAAMRGEAEEGCNAGSVTAADAAAGSGSSLMQQQCQAAVAGQVTSAAAGSGATSRPCSARTAAAAGAAAESPRSATQQAALDAAAVACLPGMFRPTIWHSNMPAFSELVTATAAERQKFEKQAAARVQLFAASTPVLSSVDHTAARQTTAGHTVATAGQTAAAAQRTTGTALDIQALLKWPSALQSRVIWMWLQQQLHGMPTYLMVQEVLLLLMPRKGNGAKTGTLLDSCCVMRHKLPGSSKQLLVLSDVAAAHQLHAGQLQLQIKRDSHTRHVSRRRVLTMQQRAMQELLFPTQAMPRECASSPGKPYFSYSFQSGGTPETSLSTYSCTPSAPTASFLQRDDRLLEGVPMFGVNFRSMETFHGAAWVQQRQESSRPQTFVQMQQQLQLGTDSSSCQRLYRSRRQRQRLHLQRNAQSTTP